MKRLIWVCSLVLILVFLCSYAVLADSEFGSVRVGVGVGIPYGGIVGCHLEFSPIDYFAITAGLGVGLEKVNPTVGARVYFNGKDSRFRPRLGFYQGMVADADQGFSDYKDITGTAVGVGFTWNIRHKVSMDFDIINISSFDTDMSQYTRQDNSDIKISIGVGFRLK